MKNVEVPEWLERLPLAPEFHPTDTEFADPIAYISKIEQEASAFGICKIIPPLPKPPRKYVLHNLNKTLSKCPELGSDVNLAASPKKESGDQENCDRTVHKGGCRAVFTTRHQELGCEKGKKVKGGFGDTVFGAQKQVWQSGEVYTLEQFEVKSKNFAKSYLGMVKDVNPLVIEALFWKAASEKPIYVEYANDVPGSGFGEPEGLLPYFHKCRRRRRRKRNSFDRNSLQNNGSSTQVDRLNSISDSKESDGQSSSMVCTETPNHLSSVQPHCSNSLPKDFLGSGDKEGTAGWKLSNSPWNLQVIARSPGSLTRFMPDDIPGVTSPMVYIGMLFSWFAWHVEDHELHSLNYLHMGSPKTWYAVPGECAVDFEQAIRQHAYGGNTDWLVALSLLGEKTTVLSPEVIVSSGIPCCRLVQNPGEFVVTFPRAYHIGFSHGFNCGEAANFGTPKWLTIAKEAAVRRSAMNYLPMLSHQQLLYLLTMSFISRIPRSLLPGVRSSRLRDRQKEERELSVKKAFIEDIVHENSLLKVLLKRNSSYRAILWDAESLPSSSKESEVRKDADADSSTLASTDKGSTVNNDNVDDLGDLSMYIGAVAFDLNDDDLAYDFQIESGTLPCVACGVLGFPFMATVQPSKDASTELLLAEPLTVSDATCVEVGISRGWNVSNALVRPRIFCLEHAIEIEKVLSSKGGANVLIICHSDFQKIKTHAAVIAEEIGTPYCYTEIPLVEASPEDLNVLDIAIDKDEQVGHAEDWTSKLNVNLHHCVQVKKSSPAKNIKHLLGLGALFSDAVATPTLIVTNASNPGVKWQSRKVRSTRHLKNLKGKSCANDGVVTNEEQQHQPTKEDVKIIQYSRKKYKVRVAEVVHGVSDGNDLSNGKRNRGYGSVQDSQEQRINSETVSVIASDENDVKETSTQNGLDGDANTGEIRCNEQTEAVPGHDQLVNTEVSNFDIPGSEDNQFVLGEGDSGHASVDDDKDDGKNNDLDKLDSNAKSVATTGSGKRKRELRLLQSDDHFDMSGFIRSPCEGLRSRARAPPSTPETENAMKKMKKTTEDSTGKTEKALTKPKKTTDDSNFVPHPKGTGKKERQKGQGRYECDLDGCTMGFATKAELLLHKANRCPVDGCRKKFNSHKYAIQHQRVHDDDRPLKCPWSGCNMSFKWAWARTEHFRVHTGERPYTCKVEGCGLTFRFVSDFSRHRRKTGHYVISQKAA